ncbi:hypothetical protein AB1Y20_011382 [Prymnesium parvum]|uniref:Magnesium transporter n=1 Tax=Prymnesium parvum TaxID=97485 RepID=A0AB34IMP1_PRYPA
MLTNRALGIVMAIVANLLIACSLILQKWVHMAISPAPHAADPSSRKSSDASEELAVTRHPLFWCAITGLVVGEIGNFAAFGLASPTVVSPLGAVAVIANAVLAATVLREPFSCRNFLGVLFTISGAVVVVTNSPPKYEELTVDSFVNFVFSKPSFSFVTFLAVAIPLLLVAEPLYGKRFLLVNVMLCSLLGSITVACSAAASTFVRDFVSGQYQLALHPASWCLAVLTPVTAVLQLKHLNKALHHHSSSQVVPVYYITFTLSSISASGIVYQDFWAFTPTLAAGFSVGCFLCFFGVYLLSKKPPPKVPHHVAQNPREDLLLRASTASLKGSCGRGCVEPTARDGGCKLQHEKTSPAAELSLRIPVPLPINLPSTLLEKMEQMKVGPSAKPDPPPPRMGHRRAASDPEAKAIARRIRKNLAEISQAISTQLDRNIGFETSYEILEADADGLPVFERGIVGGVSAGNLIRQSVQPSITRSCEAIAHDKSGAAREENAVHRASTRPSRGQSRASAARSSDPGTRLSIFGRLSDPGKLNLFSSRSK